MKLILKNFLCHTEATFDIPDIGFHKLSGTHGAGKSTIYAAIYYALYGKLFRKVKTPYSFGKKDCAVTFESEGLWIYRTSGKKSLTVKIAGVKYNDESAQSMINSFIGMDADEFLLSSYIVQNGAGSESILKLTPAKKLEFFEKLVYRGDAIQTFQEKLKAKKLELDHKHAVLSGQQQAFEKQISEFESVDSSPVEDPGETSQSVKQELNTLNRKVTQLGSEMATIRDAITKSEENTNALARIEVELEALRKETELEVPEDVSEIMNEKENEIERFGHKKALEKELSQLRLSFKEIDPLTDDDLKQIESELQVHKAIYENSTEYQKVSEALDNNKKEVTRIFKEIKVSLGFFKKTISAELLALKRLLGNRGLVCPCCKKKVDLVEGQLKVSEPDMEAKEVSREQVLKFIKALESLVLKKEELKTKLDTLQPPEEESYLSILEIYEEEKKKAEDAKTQAQIKTKIEKLEHEIASLTFTSDETNVRKELERLRSLSFERNSILKRKSDASAKIKNLTQRKNTLKEAVEDSLRFGGSDKLKELEMQRERLSTKRSELSERLELALRFETSNTLYEKYQSALENLERVGKTLSELGDELKGIKDLERKGKEARLLALYENIENINVRASIYLRELFDDPVSISLIPVTPTGTQKIQIDTKINFKNNEYSDFGEFSGGETQLAELAFMLAINDAIGSKFLFLDECLNNLHQDSNVDILNYLKSKASERLILVVSHESSDGVFDSIIPV